jgi:hypothetical protein
LYGKHEYTNILKIADVLDKQEMDFLNEWNKLPPIYDGNNYEESRKYENIAGAINHIEECKKLLRFPPLC